MRQWLLDVWHLSLRYMTAGLVFAVIGLAVMLLSGCAVGAAAPGYVKCKGKGVITGNGAGSMAVIYGAGGLNAFTLSMDCGEGLEFEQGKVLTPAVAPTPTPTPMK